MTRTDHLRTQKDGERSTILRILKKKTRVVTSIKEASRILGRFPSLITREAIKNLTILSIAATAIIQEEVVAVIIITHMDRDVSAPSRRT